MKTQTKARGNRAEETSTVSLLHDWEDFLKPQPPYKERLAQGKRLREECSRNEHSKWTPDKNRPSPLELLASQDETRVQSLIPLRYGRMTESPFAFFRGSALLMASDLSTMPRTKIITQLCGDCHLSNFGVFATAERNVIFDLNDFDETLPGPFEWDLKRLAASFVVAAQHNGFSQSTAERCVRSMVAAYRSKMAEFAQMKTLEIWYDRVDFEELASHIKKPGRRISTLEKLAKLKEKRSQAAAVAKLTEVVNGNRRIKDSPPVVFHPEAATAEVVKEVLHNYAESLWPSRQTLLQRFHFIDVALKVVGVGSVGTRAFVILLQGEGGDEDHIFLQAKQARPSILEAYLGKSDFDHPGARVVNGQRVLQAASDLFLGWTTDRVNDIQYYIRQLMDVKESIAVDELDATTFEQYGHICARVLARGHARTGDPVVIHGYIGKSETFDEAMTKFAFAYAKQNERDFQELVDAANKGKIAIARGL